MSWLYVDSNEKIQGPFKTETIKTWITNKQFPPEIKIKPYGSKNPFIPIYLIDVFKQLFNNTINLNDYKNLTNYNIAFENKIEKKFQHKTKKFQIGDGSTIGPAPKSPELHWLYIDNNEKIQGPFSNSLMHLWFRNGNFDNSLRVHKYYRQVGKTNQNPKNLILSNYKRIYELNECDFIKNYNEKSKLNWTYLDEEENEYGPFSSKTMLKWVQRGFLKNGLKIRCDITTEFFPLNLSENPFGLEYPETLSWSFIDDNGEEHGKFTSSKMALWYLQGYFRDDILCKSEINGSGFCPISQISSILIKMQTEPMEKMNVPKLKTPISKEHEDKWYFIDLDEGKEQGPFSTEAMKNWCKKGFLPMFIKVKKENEREYVNLNKRKDILFDKHL